MDSSERDAIGTDAPVKGAVTVSYLGKKKLGETLTLFLVTEVSVIPSNGEKAQALLRRDQADFERLHPDAKLETTGGQTATSTYHTFDRKGWNDRAGRKVQVFERGAFLVRITFSFLDVRRDDWEPSMGRFLKDFLSPAT